MNETFQDTRRRRVGFGVAVLAMGFVFAGPLGRTVEFAVSSDLQSHIVLVPFISAYLAYLKRARLPAAETSWALGGSLAAIGVLSVGMQALMRGQDLFLGPQDALTLPLFAFVTGVVALVALFFGAGMVCTLRFPLLFLFFMVPLPAPVAHAMAEGLQRASAEATQGFFMLTGTAFLRDGMVFHLPGLTLEVAEECSGIHSSLVLFMTSLLAAHLFLARPWSRAALVCAVIPLGIVRNGFRVVSLALLTIHVDPAIIDSPLHHRGGPIFFVLSLIALLGLLVLLRWIEKRRGRGAVSAA